MKLSAKTTASLVLFSFLGALIGGLAWEVIERVAARVGLVLDLSVGPIGFDLKVISLHFLVNPGTVLGLIGGILLFRLL